MAITETTKSTRMNEKIIRTEARPALKKIPTSPYIIHYTSLKEITKELAKQGTFLDVLNTIKLVGKR